MAMRMLIPGLVIFVMGLYGTSHAALLKTTSTPIAGAACVSVANDQETGDTVRRCPGINGLALLVHNSDDRASLSILTKEKTALPLNFWDTVTPTFSTLGPTVEWQFKTPDGKGKPVAIVVRVDTVDQADVAAPRPVSFIVVARIDEKNTCVIGKIPAQQAHATEAARALAQATGTKCLPQLR